MNDLQRRHWLKQMARAGIAGGLTGGIASAFGPIALAQNRIDNDKILVVLELSGGNDGLNTVVPYGDDAYYRYRPKIGLPAKSLRTLDERFGLNPGMAGMERLWKDGQLAIVHGCGYEKPSYSHFTSMAYWHTASPNSGDDYGWMGRLADAMSPPKDNFMINVDTEQSLAVRCRLHTPVVFNDPMRFERNGYAQSRSLLDTPGSIEGANESLQFLKRVAASAQASSQSVRQAWANYKSPVDYGLVPVQLPKIAACIAAGLPSRLYYTSYAKNVFDTHVQQTELHQRLLTYVSDTIAGFLKDMERIGQADRVVLLVFSEFGRRVPENTSLGTDHGTSNVMFFAGKPVRGGHYGKVPDLGALVDGENLPLTTDFRRVYASAIDGWLDTGLASKVLKANFETLPIFNPTPA